MASLPSIPTMNNTGLATPRPEEPADQWASSTLSALHPGTEHAGTAVAHPSEAHISNDTPYAVPGTASTATTPGLNMPGGFPGPKGAQPDMEHVKGVAMNAFETAQVYAATAAATATTAAQTAGETVSQYLPESVKSYLPGSVPGSAAGPNTTLPSQETSQNRHPSSTGGVGTLPGPPGETGVAILPHERTGGVSTDKLVYSALKDTSVNKSSPISTTTNNNPVSFPTADVTTSSPKPTSSNPTSKHTGFIPSPLRTDSATSLAKLPEERKQETLPSHDDESSTQPGKFSGVGKLPGAADESGVALVPDEKLGKVDERSVISTSADTDASVKTLPGSTAPGLDVDNITGSSTASGTTSAIPGGVGQGSGADIGGPQTTARQHPLARDEKAVLEKDDGKFLKKGQVDTTNTSVGHQRTTSSKVATPGHGDTPANAPAKKASSGSSGRASSSSPTKKHGFMDKVKGEMKVLSGKMSKDESKIEEGKKLMGKN